MFKRSMLVAAMLGLTSGAHAVSLITPNAKPNITPQAVGAGTYVQAQEFKVTITDDLDLNGKSMQVTFSKPLIAALMPTTLTEDDSAAGCDAGAITSVTYAGLTNDNKTANYTFVSDNAKDPGDCVVKVNKMYFAAGDLTTTGITAVSSFTLIGSGVSPSLSKTVLDLSKDQFKVTVGTAANEKINVNTARKTYAGGDADTIVFTVGDLNSGNDTISGTVTGQEITITGDFSWADDPLTPTFDPTTQGNRLTVPVAITGSAAFVPAKSSTTSLVFSDTNNDGTYTLTLTPIKNNNLADANAKNDVNAVAMPVSTYTVGTKVSYTDVSVDALGADKTLAGSQIVAGVAAGAHALNGASTKIFAVPFGSEVESHNIFVSNSGKSSGAITGSLSYAGNAAVAMDLGTANPGVTYLNVMAALEALGEKPAFGRGDLTLTVNAPETDITFTAGYTTATGRANLFMQEQANIAAISNAAKTSAAAAAADAAIACDNVVTTEGNLDNIAGSSITVSKADAGGAAAYTHNGTGAGADALTACP